MLLCVGDVKGGESPIGGLHTPCVSDVKGREPPMGGYALPCSSACIYKKKISEIEVKKKLTVLQIPCISDCEKIENHP